MKILITLCVLLCFYSNKVFSQRIDLEKNGYKFEMKVDTSSLLFQGKKIKNGSNCILTINKKHCSIEIINNITGKSLFSISEMEAGDFILKKVNEGIVYQEKWIKEVKSDVTYIQISLTLTEGMTNGNISFSYLELTNTGNTNIDAVLAFKK